MVATPVAFLDASVLYPALLRNMLMHFAVENLFQPRWSARVQEEWMAALLRRRPDISREQLLRTRRLMELHADEALVEGFEGAVNALILPDPDDRHVLAAAIHCGAKVIVTANLRHFPATKLAACGIRAEHPDDFLAGLLSDNPQDAIIAFLALCGNRRNPPQSPLEVTYILASQGLPKTAAALMSHLHPPNQTGGD